MEAITTLRLHLRPFTPEDLPDLAAILADSEVTRFSLIEPKSLDDTRALLGRILATYEKEGFGLYAVIHLEEGKLIGYCGFSVRRIDDRRTIELGCGLARSFWGMGLATEATQACRDYGFEKLGFQRMVSIVDPENRGSIRVAEKLGMRFEKESEFQGAPLDIYGINRGTPSL